MALNETNILPGPTPVPVPGDRVVRVGETVPIKWISNDISLVDITVSNGVSSVQILDNKATKNGSTNTADWNVTKQQEEQFQGTKCNVTINMDGNTEISDISKEFWILDDPSLSIDIDPEDVSQ